MELKIHKGFFNTQTLNQIKEHCEKAQSEIHIKAKGTWASNLTEGRGDVNIHILREREYPILFKTIVEKMEQSFDRTPAAIMFYYWDPESFVGWHNDANHSAAASIYLNKNWEPNYGGYFMYKKQGDHEIKAEKPSYNKCIFQSGSVWHATTLTHWKAPIRKSLQVFFDE